MDAIDPALDDNNQPHRQNGHLHQHQQQHQRHELSQPQQQPPYYALNSPSFPPNPSSRLPPAPSHNSPPQAYYNPPLTPRSQQTSAAAALEVAQKHGSHDSPDATDSYDGIADANGAPSLDSPHDPKRSRACEACRGLKVRCDQDSNDPEKPCKRCAKANRVCVITPPSRKRQKKTDNRVAELEKKIDALTASLQAQKGAEHGEDGYAPQHGYVQSADTAYGDSRQQYAVDHGFRTSTDASYPPPQGPMHGRELSQTKNGHKRPHSGEHHVRMNSASREVHPRTMGESAGSAAWVTNTSGGHVEARHHIGDILDHSTAERIFARYTRDMAVHMPAVVFPRNTTAAMVKESKPILFLAILSAGSVGMTDLKTQRDLTKAMLGIFADCIIRSGEKSLELVQALQVSTLWYRPPERYEHMNFYQLIHIASVMAIDLGMGKKYKTANGQLRFWAERGAKAAHGFDSVEMRRAWLSCYFLSANVSMSMRRPNLIRWTTYMDDCLEVLEASADSFYSDKVLCQHVRVQHICEEIGAQFSMDDPSATIAISDPKVQYAIKIFENELREWKSLVPKKMMNPNLEFSMHVTGLYIHEVALHVNHNVDDFRAPFTEESLSNNGNAGDILTPAHISALTECLTSVHGILNTFLGFELDIIRTLPIFYFVRVAYAVVVLIKMYFAVAAPNSEIGKIISKEDLRVESHLDSLVTLFRTSADEGSFRPASKFLFILSKLREWFQKHRDGKSGTRTGEGGASPVQKAPQQQVQQNPQHQQQQYVNSIQSPVQMGYNPANTPLHLLSEVAMGNSNDAANRQARVGRQSNHQQPLANPNMAGWYPGMAVAGHAHTMGPHGPMDINALAAEGALDYGHSPGNGFEQAMDLTLGAADGDFSNIFQGDGLFNFSLDGAGNMFQNWNWGSL